MPTTDNSQQNNIPFTNPIDEITHITEEMYKKNSELNVRNKTLALLRNIDSIVLSSVTDTKLIGQKVADLLVKEEFQLVQLHVLTDSILTPVAISSSGKSAVIEKFGRDRFLSPPFSLIDRHNLLVRTVNHKYIHVTDNLHEVFTKNISEDEARDIQKNLGIKSIISYPLKVRKDIIGILVIGISDEKDKINADNRALIDRLAGVVGIALDNALLYQSIQEANERLKQVDHLKDEFVSLASHELRTPMTVIKSYLWMFLDKKGKDLNIKEREYIERAYTSTERLIKLVNDMLNVSRIESGRLKLEMKDLDILQLTQRVVSELIPRGVELGLKVVFIKPDSLVKTLNGDADRIEQILINLIGNSLKFTPPGGEITVSLVPREKDVMISVADTGRGILKQDMGKLFQKFGMTGSAYLQKQQNQGSGLGLYLSKSLVELHSGKINVESAGENKGTTFTFTLPYNEDIPHQEAEVLPAGSMGVARVSGLAGATVGSGVNVSVAGGGVVVSGKGSESIAK